MDTPKQTALYWLSQGVATVPLCYRSKVPAIKWTEYRTHLPTETIINLWYQEPRNIALICGWQRLICMDFDSVENYCAWHCWQLEHNPKILATYKTLTSRGVHCFFYLKEDVKLTTIQHSLFELKSGGKLVTIPPSIHSSGKAYQPMDDFSSVQTVSVEQILNYSPVTFQPLIVWPTRSKYAPTSLNNESSLISQIKERIKMLDFFPNARRLDNEGRFWLGDCPFHGHHSNFWIDAKSGRGGCYAGCGNFDVISLFGKMNGISDKEAILLLSKEI